MAKIIADPNHKQRVGIDLPLAMIERLDHEARRRGVSRQALLKVWLADRLDAVA